MYWDPFDGPFLFSNVNNLNWYTSFGLLECNLVKTCTYFFSELINIHFAFESS